MAPHSSTLAWKVPWTEEPDRLQCMGSLGVRHDWANSLYFCTFMHWRRKWQPTPVFLPGESQGQGAWWAAVYGVAQSQTWLKRLSSSSSSRSAAISAVRHSDPAEEYNFINSDSTLTSKIVFARAGLKQRIHNLTRFLFPFCRGKRVTWENKLFSGTLGS